MACHLLLNVKRSNMDESVETKILKYFERSYIAVSRPGKPNILIQPQSWGVKFEADSYIITDESARRELKMRKKVRLLS